MRENKGRRIVTFTGTTTTATLLLGLVMTTAPAAAPAADGTHHPNPPAATAAADPDWGDVQVAPPARRTVNAKLGTRTTARWAGAINTGSLSSVNAAYASAYAPRLTLPVQWLLGSLLGCAAGITSSASTTQTLVSLNFVRSMAGLAPVVFSSAMNASAQKAALIMAANDDLSHDPPGSWRCWNSVGARAAGKSNLALAHPSLKSGQIVDLYMDDPGSNNAAVGHRRWVLNPFSTVMGSGSTSTANALTVVGPTSAARPNPKWVGWPTAGYFPNALEPQGRWSLSSGSKAVSFAGARVAVFKGSTRIAVRKYAVHNGYAQPTLVWQMPAGFDKRATYRVFVTGIKKAGAKKKVKTSYVVKLFTPSL